MAVMEQAVCLQQVAHLSTTAYLPACSRQGWPLAACSWLLRKTEIAFVYQQGYLEEIAAARKMAPLTV